MSGIPVSLRHGTREPSPGPRGSTVPLAGIAQLVAELRRRGYRVIAPVVRDGALVLDEIRDADELPRGIGVESGPGRYRLVEREDGALFANSVGPMPWKRFLRPVREKVLDVERGPDGDLEFSTPDEDDEPALAFLGVRPCDLRALAVLDRVFGADGGRSGYATRRSRAFIVAVECTTPAETCFCTSAGGAPAVDPPGSATYDLALTEIVGGHSGHGGHSDRFENSAHAENSARIESRGHRFFARSGSCLGADVLKAVTRAPADGHTAAAARDAVDRAAASMSRRLPSVDLRALMAASVNARHWNDIAERCLACGNCTLVCPTCFCTTTEDVTDLTGDHAERWTRWDSCFDLEFSYVHGGEIRSSVQSRYRQWLTHKFATWQDQFGTAGCVGCGRCVAWCPAGIDLTDELRALQEEWVLEANDE